ncbi:MAG: hypothetical protein WD601_03545, partial [Pseudohongiellaceae bacterium]
DNDFEKVRTVAFVLKTLLDQMSVSSFVKTTGSRGVHLHIPLKVEHEFAKVKDVAHNLAQVLHRKCPQLTTLEMHKDKRGNRVFLDYLRNDYGMTAIAPYSLRAVASAAAATPIDWDELKDNSLGPQSYGYRNIFRRLPHKENPWESFYKSRVGLAKLQL